MHQFRDKAGAARERASAGLLFYPVLMAADVLAYRAHEVPVGEDQREHIELMRDVAEAFNKRFGETLVVPEGNIPTVGARVRDLKEPEKKMSTTGGTPKGTVYVDEEPASDRQEVQGAADRLGPEIVCADDKPGITNLIEILAVRARTSRPPTIEHDFAGSGTATSRQPWAKRSPPGWRPCASATWSYATTRPHRGLPGARRGEGPRDRRAGRRGRARGDGRRARPTPA